MQDPLTAPDHALLAALAQGDCGALEGLYRRHKDALFNVAHHLTGDSGRAEDVLQDVFVNLARGGRRLRVHGNVRCYLLAAAVNRARDLMRRAAPHSLTGDLPVADPLQGKIEAGHRAARVAGALSSLPVEQREVVVLHVFEGLAFREVGSLLGIPADTAASRYRYAREKLQQRLAPTEVER